jgi:regulator of protease activity HflC (stomatin/prohibitin superfamily)
MVLLVPAKTKEERKYNDSNPHKAGWWLLAVASVLSVASFIICLIVIVPTGNVAVMVRFQKPTGEVLEQGIHSKNIVDGPIMLSIRTQLFKDDVTAASKDLQDVKTSIAINYHLDQYRAKEVYQTIGYNYIDIIANPIVQETIKEVTAKYNAEDMIIKRPEVKNVIAEALTTRLQVRGIAVESVNITNFEFSKSFTDAIESKVVAAQSVLQSQNKLLQVGVEAQQAKALAEGTADAAVARADGQAKANAILEASLTDKVLQYMFIDKMGGNVQVWVIPQNQAFTIAPDSTIKPITTATPVPKFTPVPVPTPMPSATTPK